MGGEGERNIIPITSYWKEIKYLAFTITIITGTLYTFRKKTEAGV